MFVTRFAPSPTGYLHLGHAYSALFAAQAAEGGRFLLRIEDIDPTRCKPEFTEAIFEDLHWLGLTWPEPVRIQSQHMGDYAKALGVLREKNLLYPCFCTRREIEYEAQLAANAPHDDDGNVIYPGTCRALSPQQCADRFAQQPIANWRLNVEAAMCMTGPLLWHDKIQGSVEVQPQIFGDVVLARKDIPTSYHLSVTVDDHLQGVSLVTRGEDLFSATHIHRLLQALLGYKTPEYHHHRLIMDTTGRRYAKRDKSVTLRSLRAKNVTPESLISQLMNC